MSNRPQLVLDLGGVLLTSLRRTFWLEMSQLCSMSADELYRRYAREIRDPLLRGWIADEHLFAWVAERCRLSAAESREHLLDCVIPLQPYSLVPEWAEYADVSLLANHRSEWVAALVEDLHSSLREVAISDKLGLVLPDGAAYDVFAARLDCPPEQIIFVNDDPTQLVPAQERGWQTILADPRLAWVREINERLTGAPA